MAKTVQGNRESTHAQGAQAHQAEQSNEVSKAVTHRMFARVGRECHSSRSRAASCAMTDREQLHYDYLIVGAGPSGLACALRLRQLRAEASIAVLEKGSSV